MTSSLYPASVISASLGGKHHLLQCAQTLRFGAGGTGSQGHRVAGQSSPVTSPLGSLVTFECLATAYLKLWPKYGHKCPSKLDTGWIFPQWLHSSMLLESKPLLVAGPDAVTGSPPLGPSCSTLHWSFLQLRGWHTASRWQLHSLHLALHHIPWVN